MLGKIRVLLMIRVSSVCKGLCLSLARLTKMLMCFKRSSDLCFMEKSSLLHLFIRHYKKALTDFEKCFDRIQKWEWEVSSHSEPNRETLLTILFRCLISSWHNNASFKDCFVLSDCNLFFVLCLPLIVAFLGNLFMIW